MAAKKNGVKFDFTKGDVAAHIARDVNATYANAKNTWTIMKGYVELNSLGKLPASEAKRLLNARRDALQAKYKANHDPRIVAPVVDTRISEMAGILRLGEWKCWPTAFAHIKDIDVNIDTVNTVSKIVRKLVKGKELKASADSCPSKEVILAEVKRRKTSRRGKGGKANGNKAFTATQTETSLERMSKSLNRIAKWFGKDAKPLVAAAKRSIDTLAREAAKVSKARDKAEAAAEAA